MRRSWAAAGAAILILAFASPVAAANRSGDVAVHYYLSLGDSLAAGEQPTGDFSQGYTDQLYQMAKADYPKLRHIKLGCSGGETTVTFINGGICDYEYGSQLATALEFLHAHARFTSFITIDIGWNDLDAATPCVRAHPDQAVACIQPYVAQIATNMPVILAALKEAAPDVPIVGMNLYDPFLAFWLQGTPEGQYLAQLSVDLVAGTPANGVNDLVAGIYGAAGIPVADVESAFNTTDWTLVPFAAPYGEAPLNVATICNYTWVCAPPPLGPNNHATTAGYHAIALAFADVLGL